MAAGAKRKITRTRFRVDDYPAEARELLDKLLADIRYTYQDISEEMAAKQWPISKSAIGRYARSTQAAAERIRKATEQTRILVQQIKDGQDMQAAEVGTSLMLDGLINRLVTADEEYEEMPLDKAGDLLVKLQRSGVYKDRYKEDRKKTIDTLRDNLLAELRNEIHGNEELLEQLSGIIGRIADKEAESDGK